jgi:mono/diheme cytochrome c family protein
MRIFLKILRLLFLIVIIVIAAALSYLYGALPKKEKPKQITIEATPARLQRGAYLAHHVNVCMHCHSERKFEYFATPFIPGTEGKGELFVNDEKAGEIYSPNITPYKLSNWSDGEIIRALTAGVNKTGDPLFPIMPYSVYANLKEEDLYSIVAYLRTLKPIVHEVPRSRLKFPLFLIVRMIPAPAQPDRKAQQDPGHYLATIAGCLHCHTPTDEQKRPIWDKMGSGGQDFTIVKSANITPDPETGIGSWSKQDFIEKFKKWEQPELRQVVTPENRNTVMPWIEFSGMKEEDLAAIYDYLRTIPPIRNTVEKWK